MRNVSKIENESKLLDDRKLRDVYAGRIEVLDKVKKLLLLPMLESMTTQQVADYYGVGKKAIESIYTRHNDELIIDGIRLCKRSEFLNLQHEGLENVIGKTIINLPDGTILEVPNRGLKIFPRRAILRIGMLLRDSEVAKEVRTQLLNIEEKISVEVKKADIEEEQNLMMEVGRAVASGDVNAVAIASTNLIAFKNRHIEKLENDNKGLAGEILEWKDRDKLNAGIRKLAAVTGIPFPNMWNELYKNLQYKYKICVKQRGEAPYIQWIEKDEWKEVLKVFCAMCEAYKKSPTDMFQQTVPKEKLAKEI